MEAYKRGSHTVWDCKYHVVWITKYRYPVLGGDVGIRCRELLRETARAQLFNDNSAASTRNLMFCSSGVDIPTVSLWQGMGSLSVLIRVRIPMTPPSSSAMKVVVAASVLRERSKARIAGSIVLHQQDYKYTS
jgi:hypothetical protein